MEAPTEQSNKPRAVFIVEDDNFLREIAGQKISDAGFEVMTAQDGKKAFELLDSSPTLPSIVILDLILPGMSGFDILKQLKESDRYKEIPVLILSNLGQEEDVHKAKELGAVDYMVKAHFSFAEIITKIKDTISA